MNSEYTIGENGPSVLRTWSGEEGGLSVFVGSLEPHSLTCQTRWQQYKHNTEPYGFFHKMAAKEGLIDSEGDDVTAVLHFAVYYGLAGAVTEGQAAEMRERVNDLIRRSVLKVGAKCPRVVAFCVEPPEYMLEELTRC